MRYQFVSEGSGTRCIRMKPPNVNRKDNWLTIMTVVVFVMAAAGAVFALYTLLPALLGGSDLKYSVFRFGAILVAAFFLVGLIARLRRR